MPSISCSSMPTSPTAPGSPSRRCWRRSSAAPARHSVRLPARLRFMGWARRRSCSRSACPGSIWRCSAAFSWSPSPSRRTGFSGSSAGAARPAARHRQRPERCSPLSPSASASAGLVAGNGISLPGGRGSITGLIGPNGAGKTTLFALIAGFVAPTSGRILFEGRDVTTEPPHERARMGIARTFQIVQPFAGLSVAENIAVGAYLRHARRADAVSRAAAVARRVGLHAEIDRPAASLTVAGRKRLELARALATEPKILLLDEVLAGLNPSEIRDMVPVIRAIRGDGVTIFMIEHVMQAVMDLCETVHVLSQGRLIAQGAPEAVCADPQVIEAYLGKGAAQRFRRPEPARA